MTSKYSEKKAISEEVKEIEFYILLSMAFLLILIFKIASRLNEVQPGLELDTIGLAYLTDFYYDARYPGDDFYTVTKEEFEKCLSIMYDTVNKLKANMHIQGERQ